MGYLPAPALTHSISERSILRDLTGVIPGLDPLLEDDAWEGLTLAPPSLKTQPSLLKNIDENYFDSAPQQKTDAGLYDFTSLGQDLIDLELPLATPVVPVPLQIKVEPQTDSGSSSSSDGEISPRDETTSPATAIGRPTPVAISKRKRSKSLENALVAVAVAESHREDEEDETEVAFEKALSEPHFQWEACAGCRSVKQVCKVQAGIETILLPCTTSNASTQLTLAHIPFAEFGLVISEPPAPGTAASQVGLQQGDVVLSIDGTSVNAVEVAKELLASADRQATLLVERPQTCARCTKMGKECARAHGLKKSFTSCACCTDPKVKKRCLFSQSNLACDRCVEQGTECSRSLGDTSKKQKQRRAGRKGKTMARRMPATVQMNLRI